jgi:hypothetical protein
MLLAWVPPQWAMFGTLLVALRLGAGSYWNQGYWGGSIAAIGGALLYGAVRRIWQRVRARDAVVLCVALALLANSRPFEGLLVAAPAGLAIAAGLALRRLRPHPWARLLAPVGLLLPLLVLGLAAYNRAVTGDASEIPHELHRRTHRIPVFVWQGGTELASLGPAPDPGVLAEEPRDALDSSAWGAPESSGWHRLGVVLYFFLGLPMALALLVTPAAVRLPWSRFAAGSFLMLAAGHFLIIPWFSHYAAPALGLCLVLAVEAQRLVYSARLGDRESRRRRIGPALFGAGCLIQIVMFVIEVPAHRADHSDPSRQRARLAWDFERREGRHLILVGYPQDLQGDWTYNRADVDAAKVIWANDLGDEANDELLRYYRDRTVWRVRAEFTTIDPVPHLVRPALIAGPPNAAREMR